MSFHIRTREKPLQDIVLRFIVGTKRLFIYISRIYESEPGHFKKWNGARLYHCYKISVKIFMYNNSCYKIKVLLKIYNNDEKTR